MTTAIEALLSYQQADEDGVMVITSRQAIHEVVNQVASLRATLDGMGTSTAVPDPDLLDRLELAFTTLADKFKKLPRPSTDRIDMLQYCIGAIRDVRHAPQAQPIDANTPPPLERRLLLWFIGREAPKAAHCWTIGTVSAHQIGEVWIDGDYRPIEWFSHWRELPPHLR